MSFNIENITLEDTLTRIKALESKVSELEQRNANLTELIVKNQKKMFGKSSEQLQYHHATRSAKVVEQILGNYVGFVQTDGCASYNAAIKATHVGCWVHVKRKWVDCLPKVIDGKNLKAAQALELIERIFATDKGFEGVSEKEG